jgi:glyoxylate reductase
MTLSRRCPNPRVVVTRELPDSVMDRMEALFDASTNRDDRAMDAAALRSAAQDCDVLVPTVTDMIDAELIAAAGERLKLIANFGAGVNHIDLRAARARGIIVTNTPGVLTEDTADMAMALIVSVPRRLAEGEKLVRSGEWKGWSPGGMLGHRIGARRWASSAWGGSVKPWRCAPARSGSRSTTTTVTGCRRCWRPS